MTESPATAEIADEIARALLEIGAFVFSPDEPFTWASGIRSPLYCDNRLVLGHPAARRRVVTAMARRYHALEPPQPDLIVGTATAGIPHAAWLSEALDLPMAYVRSNAKTHGKSRIIEGVRPSGQRALLVEDLVSTGGSSIAAVQALRSAGITVNTVFAIFTYGLPASVTAFAEADVELRPLTSLDRLLSVAVDDNMMDATTAGRIVAWRDAL